MLCLAASFLLFILSRMLRYYRDYSYWFFLLYCSVISRSFLNFSTLSGFIFPAFISFRLCLSQVYSRLYGHRHHSPANQCCVQFVQHRESGCSSRKEKFYLLKWGCIKPLYIQKDEKTTRPRRISRFYLAVTRIICTFVPTRTRTCQASSQCLNVQVVLFR